MNNRGFTLIELLATMAVLAIIMLIAIPNVVGIIDRNKRATYVEDAKKLVTLAEYKFKGDATIPKPKTNTECIVMRMSKLDNSEIQDPPNGGVYLEDASYVVIKRNNTKYQYYVKLVEDDGGKLTGVKLTEITLLRAENATMKYVGDVDKILPTAPANLSGTGCTSIIAKFE